MVLSLKKSEKVTKHLSQDDKLTAIKNGAPRERYSVYVGAKLSDT